MRTSITVCAVLFAFASIFNVARTIQTQSNSIFYMDKERKEAVSRGLDIYFSKMNKISLENQGKIWDTSGVTNINTHFTYSNEKITDWDTSSVINLK